MSDFDAAVREATESLAEDVGVDDDARAAPMEEAVEGVAESLEDLTTQEPAGDLAALTSLATNKKGPRVRPSYSTLSQMRQ